jgi:hypothetical protein
MMSADKLRELAGGFRKEPKSRTDGALVDAIASDVVEYRDLYEANPVQLPVAPLAELLPLMGWLIYESSWESVQRIAAGFEHLAEQNERRVASEIELDHVNRLADAMRALPWPEFAPRALGAIRSQALAESKRDTEAGYDAAWLLHKEAKKSYYELRNSHGSDASRQQYVLALDEVLLQLALAETGTACRTAERVVGRWAEEFACADDAEKSRADEERWVQRMFRQLTDGLEVGELALETADRIEREHGFVDTADESRLALRTARQNPGIMTARAALLLLALWREMHRLGRAPDGFESWQAWEADLLTRFTAAYRAIEHQGNGKDGKPLAMRLEFQRQFIHVRLDLGLLKPGYSLPSEVGFAPCLARDPLDAAAVRELSQWLADNAAGKGSWRGFSAATMPAFVRSVVACRSLGPDDQGYQDWRRAWFRYEQYSDEEGRQERVDAALTAAP